MARRFGGAYLSVVVIDDLELVPEDEAEVTLEAGPDD